MVFAFLRLRSLIRQWVNRMGYDIVYHERDSCEHPLNVLEIAVREHLARDDNFYFVQVGANDGIRSDPIRALVLQHRLPGLLIEPIPYQFAQLQQNYQGHEQLSFENCAIAEVNGERDLFRVRQDADVPDWAHGLASFDEWHLASVPSLKPHVERTKVRTQTLSSVLDRHRVRHVSLLLVDVEGFDYQVVRLALEAGCAPELIYYEHCNLSPQDKLSCHQLLKRNNYRFIEVGRDVLAVRQR